MNLVESHSGRIEGAERDQWFFFPGSFDPLPWNVAEEIAPLELLLHALVKPESSGTWSFYKYQIEHEIVYSAYPTECLVIHIQTRKFADLILYVLMSFLKTARQEKAAPEERRQNENHSH